MERFQTRMRVGRASIARHAGLPVAVVQRQCAAAAGECAMVEHRQHHFECQSFCGLVAGAAEPAGVLALRRLQGQFELIVAFVIDDLHYFFFATWMEQNGVGVARSIDRRRR